MLVLGVGCHRVELGNVAVPNPEREHVHPLRLEARGHGGGVGSVGEPVGQEEHGLRGVGAGRLQYFLTKADKRSCERTATSETLLNFTFVLNGEASSSIYADWVNGK